MKGECVKEKLESAVRKAERIVGKNLSLPVLSCVYLELNKNTLLVKATNLDLGIEVSVPVKGLSPGVAAVPGSVLNSFLSNTPQNHTLSFESEGGVLSLETEGVKASLKTLPDEDFPLIPRITDGKEFEMPIKSFLKGLRAVSYSAAVSGMKPELSSVFINSSEDFLTFAATDSFRLAEKKIKVKNSKDFEHVLLPVKNANEIIRIFDGADEEVEVILGKNQISFKQGDTYLTSRVLDGTFPDYGQIIPKEFVVEATTLKEDLAGALRLANVFSDSLHQVGMRLVPSKKIFEIKTKNGVAGDTLSRVEAVLKGEELEINFNFKYIIDALQSIEGESLLLSWSGLHKPMVLRSLNDKSFTYLVMPLNK
ncbi:MAG: DNA polymerase III subunit beta [Candidatus Taylorbacteria bacterium RIFCSPHIGHO2_01_FULL_45_63]|uniref:Beta sliding clamp n=1 Tax=Candidatus Taylorbacteria bacterium RIFCSPHIGHO2_02_FULL_45_35 TaxID=1802311 RepID=A0A1G2MVS7_9BACT|nr:MAG: DNA polymerase III subunit beta [Candidatus Taylorbacteria bacterium RIFCSPHIGHO2_01_FULL_45_63]OHA27152.1 MAG: DNA polymerase III subunit beta [Candidatus Taylorbacteria bacterium RIFCSPHIGHO2_02_FULL_45_35]OHA33852.1 MAG: DNA polymerase III subunit beta [Candidatus Taylorbacteria bacterium RIFCSPLOWO2_01_FULL_45_34b]